MEAHHSDSGELCLLLCSHRSVCRSSRHGMADYGNFIQLDWQLIVTGSACLTERDMRRLNRFFFFHWPFVGAF